MVFQNQLAPFSHQMTDNKKEDASCTADRGKHAVINLSALSHQFNCLDKASFENKNQKDLGYNNNKKLDNNVWATLLFVLVAVFCLFVCLFTA